MPDRAEHLTVAQKAALEAELAELEGPKRAEMVEAIRVARGFGDLSENFEYHAAKNEQGLSSGASRSCATACSATVLIDEGGRGERRGLGRLARHDHRDDGETMEIEISSVGGVSPESPLGKALIGRRVGDEVAVEAPRGTWRATITAISR